MVRYHSVFAICCGFVWFPFIYASIHESSLNHVTEHDFNQNHDNGNNSSHDHSMGNLTSDHRISSRDHDVHSNDLTSGHDNAEEPAHDYPYGPDISQDDNKDYSRDMSYLLEHPPLPPRPPPFSPYRSHHQGRHQRALTERGDSISLRGVTPAPVTQSPTTPAPPLLPNLPPCRNLAKAVWCTDQIAFRGTQYCHGNFFFRRWQCCAACGKALYNADPDSHGVLTSDNVIRHLSMPNGGCNDAVSSSGESWASWCATLAVGHPADAKVNCWHPTVQLRCMKSCTLCSPM